MELNNSEWSQIAEAGGCCVITASCLSRKWTHVHTAGTNKHKDVMRISNWKFPETGVLLGNTNQSHLKLPESRKLIINGKYLPPGPHPFSPSYLEKDLLIRMHRLRLEPPPPTDTTVS